MTILFMTWLIKSAYFVISMFSKTHLKKVSISFVSCGKYLQSKQYARSMGKIETKMSPNELK